uniref:Peroxidasin n=1 Tax=Craspedacusta sowerbii TaxID=128124 RepID=V9GWQ8_CRASO
MNYQIFVSVYFGLCLYSTVSFTTGQLIRSCPRGCACFEPEKSVRCVNQGFERIPQNIPRATTTLDLRYNRIRGIQQSDFQNLTQLTTLFLSNNLLQDISENAFAHLKSLKHLYLFSNRLHQLTASTFTGLENLEQLYLQSNLISQISPDAFEHLTSLKRLYLHENKLTSLTKEHLTPMLSLKRLRVENNNIACDCNFVRAIKEVQRENNVFIAATCDFNGEPRLAVELNYNDIGCRAPQFTERPQRKVGLQGETLEFRCKGSGNPEPTVSWLKDGRALSPDVNHEMSDDGTLTLHQVTLRESGSYQCVLENAIGRISSPFEAVVLKDEALPRFTAAPTNLDAIEGSAVLFKCRAIGQPKPIIEWRAQGDVILNDVSELGRFKVMSSGDLEISPVLVSDSGFYTCAARNVIGGVTQTAELVVKAPPSFIQHPTSQEVVDSESASFECKATGYPPPAIQWLKDGGRLPSDGRHAVLPSGTLRILFAQKSNEGEYACQAINVIGVNVTKANLTVRARVPPKISVKPPDMTVQPGNAIFIRCAAEGWPAPVISWAKDGVQVSSGGRFTANASAGTIEIKGIGNTDEGAWECVARNSIGFAREQFKLTVIGSKDRRYEGDQFVLKSLEQARSEVDRAIELTTQKLRNFTPRTPGDLLALFRFPSPAAVEIARSAEIFEIALELIQKNVDSGLVQQGMRQDYHFNGLVSPEHISLLANLSGCTAHQRVANCSNICFHRKYRSIDGSCNNLNHPMWGAALTPFSRLLRPVYENGFNTPVGWNRTDALPGARKVSLDLITTREVSSDDEFTHMLMQWGQFLDHDLSFTVTSPSTTRFHDGRSCHDGCDNEHPCFPIPVPDNDPRIKRLKCLEFTRSSAVCGSGPTSLFFDVITPRQQINQITSFIDASNVYGSSEKDARDLRALEDDQGLLKEGIHIKDDKYLLPFNKDTPIDCQLDKSEPSIPCFLAGDHRVNEQLGLLAMHTLWMREHNRIARQLRRLNPHWQGEKIYQESRKIVGAEMQVITFNEWLPKVLGDHGMKLLGAYEGYDPNLDPSIFNAFATAAFRFGHTLIQPVLTRLNSSFQDIPQGSVPLHRAFFAPNRFVEEGGLDPLMRGLFGAPAKDRRMTHQLLNNELTNRLFELARAVAFDLAALNIQRGRDHGIPGYNSWRQFCNMAAAETFDDLKEEIKNKLVRDRLEALYGSVDKIDLFAGAMVEDVIPGSRLGPLLMCLLTKQFQILRHGDRFWYENPAMFLPEQLTQIKQASLARVLCDNGDDINHVQRDVFRRVYRQSEYLSCSRHPGIDLRFWKECCNENENCQAGESSFTLTNYIQENNIQARRVAETPGENHLRRARRAIVSANETMPPYGLDATDEAAHRKRNVVGKMKPTVSDIDHLEEKVYETDRMLKILKEELEDLKRNSRLGHEVEHVKDAYNPAVDGKMKPCLDRGIARAHDENWYRSFQKKCSCKNGSVICQDRSKP